MIEFRVLIPVASNEGVTFSPEHHTAFERVVLRRFGGFSLLPGTVRGQWVGDDGRTYADELRTYVIAVQSILDVGPLREVLDFARFVGSIRPCLRSSPE